MNRDFQRISIAQLLSPSSLFSSSQRSKDERSRDRDSCRFILEMDEDIRQRGIAPIIALAGENSLTAASLSGSSN